MILAVLVLLVFLAVLVVFVILLQLVGCLLVVLVVLVFFVLLRVFVVLPVLCFVFCRDKQRHERHQVGPGADAVRGGGSVGAVLLRTARVAEQAAHVGGRQRRSLAAGQLPALQGRDDAGHERGRSRGAAERVRVPHVLGGTALEVAVAQRRQLGAPALGVEGAADVGERHARPVGAAVVAVGSGWWGTGTDKDRPAVGVVAVERVLPGRREARGGCVVEVVVQGDRPVAGRFDDDHALGRGVRDRGEVVWPPLQRQEAG